MWVLKVLSIFIGLMAVASQACAGTVLITEQEASLPAERIVVPSRAVTRGPLVELVQPGETAYSPMRFQVRFQSFGGSRINTSSLRVVYLKTPEIDITPRVVPFARATGIDIPDAEIPVGEHFIRTEVTDSEGRIRTSIFVIKIAP